MLSEQRTGAGCEYSVNQVARSVAHTSMINKYKETLINSEFPRYREVPPFSMAVKPLKM
jgi:hypothetical protein